MKNNDITQLLKRYREGTLGDSELAELNRLTHRDEVMGIASQRAACIIRRRRTIVFTMAGLLLAGVTVWTLLPLHRSSAPMMAEAAIPEDVILPEPAVEQLAPTTTVIVQTSTPVKVTSRKAVQRPVATTATYQVVDEEPVVVCNNQCEADSVINDIWKFLTV